MCIIGQHLDIRDSKEPVSQTVSGEAILGREITVRSSYNNANERRAERIVEV